MRYTADVLKINGNEVGAVNFTSATVATGEVEKLIVDKGQHLYEWLKASAAGLGTLIGCDNGTSDAQHRFPGTSGAFMSDSFNTAVYKFTDPQIVNNVVKSGGSGFDSISIDNFGVIVFCKATNRAFGGTSTSFTITGQNNLNETLTFQLPTTQDVSSRISTFDYMSTKVVKLPACSTSLQKSTLTNLNGQITGEYVIPNFISIASEGLNNNQIVHNNPDTYYWGNCKWSTYDDLSKQYPQIGATYGEAASYVLSNQSSIFTLFMITRANTVDAIQTSSGQYVGGFKVFWQAQATHGNSYEYFPLCCSNGNSHTMIFFIKEYPSESRIYRYNVSKMRNFPQREYDPSQFVIDSNPQPWPSWYYNNGNDVLNSQGIAYQIDVWNNAQYNLQYNYIFELADTIELASRGSQYSYTTTATEYLCVPETWFTGGYTQYMIPSILTTRYGLGAQNSIGPTGYKEVYWGTQKFCVFQIGSDTTLTFNKKN